MRLYQLFIITIFLAACGADNTHFHLETSKNDGSRQNPRIDPERKAQLRPTPLPERFKEFIEKPSFSYRSLNNAIHFPSDNRYTKIYETYGSNKKLNHQIYEKGLRQVKIVGLDVTVERNHENNIFESLHKSQNIESLTIEVDTLRLKDKINLPSSNLTIKAKEIFFYNDAKFDLTPEEYIKRAKPRQNGKQGLKGAQIKVMANQIHQVDSGEKFIRFIANGGKGQTAGAGIDGRPGRSIQAKGNKIKKCRSIPLTPCFRDSSIFSAASNKNKSAPTSSCGSITDKKCIDEATWPTDGSNAKPGGLPGKGGDAGSIITNLEGLKSLTQLKPGAIGQEASVAKGGEAGSPRAPYVKYSNGQNWKKKKSSTSRGKNAPPPSFSTSVREGKEGKFNLVNLDKTDIYSNHSLLKKQKFIDDLFRTGQFTRVKLICYQTISKLKKLKKEEKNLQSKITISKAKQVLKSIELRKNYYGESLHSVPHLSFEMRSEIFKSEIESSFNTLYFVSWILSKNKNIEDKRRLLYQKTNELYEKNKSLNKYLNENFNQIPKIKRKSALLARDIRKFHDYLKKLKEDIHNQAISNVRSNQRSGLKKAVSTLAALSAVVPVAQPSFMAVSNGLNSLLNALESDNWSDKLKNANSLLSHVQDINFSNASKQWNQEWDRFRTSEFKNLSRTEQLKRSKELIGFISPFAKETHNQYKKWTNFRVSENELTQEIERIKSQHPIFKKATRKLNNLLERKAKIDQTIQSLLAENEKTMTQMTENLHLIADLNSSLSKEQNSLSIYTKTSLQKMKLKAMDNLEKHLFYFKRAYHYRLLKGYQSDLDLKSLFDEIQAMATEGTQRISSKDLNKLRYLYKQKISQVLNNLTSRHNNLYTEMTSRARFQLSQDELNLLSKGEKIYINPKTLGVFSNYQESIKIKSISLTKIDAHTKDKGHFDIIIDHIGHGFIQKGNFMHFFSHHSPDPSLNPFRWGARVDFDGKNLTQTPLVYSRRNQTLLNSVMNNMNQDITHYNNLMSPSAKSDLIFELRSNEKIELQNIEVEISYYFHSKR